MSIVKKMTVGVCVAVCLAGCGEMDSVELAEKVKFEMQRDLVKQDVYSTLKVKEVTLVHKDGVVYEGVAKGDVQGMPVSFSVKCEYDGKSCLWSVEPSDHNSFSVMSHKGCQYAGKMFEKNWSNFKKGAKDAYDAAAKKTGEWYDKTKEKAAASYNELTGKDKDCQNPAATNSCTTAK